jgi:hypothetical protein
LRQQRFDRFFYRHVVPLRHPSVNQTPLQPCAPRIQRPNSPHIQPRSLPERISRIIPP